MKQLMICALALSLSTTIACSKKDDDKKATSDNAAKTTSQPADTTKPVRPDEPAKPTADLVPKETTDQLLVKALDTKLDKSTRDLALDALQKANDPKAGMRLLEAAKKEKVFMIRRAMFQIAGKAGGDELTGAFLAYYASKQAEKRRHLIDMRSGIRALDSKVVFAWAAKRLPGAKDEIRYADLITDVAVADNKAAVVELLGKTKHVMARHRLASTAIKLGDTSQFKILLAGLASKDQYDRSDAGNMFAHVAKKIPADQRDEAIKLLQAAKKRARGAYSDYGFKRSLRALGVK